MLYGTSEFLTISTKDIPRYATITRIIETKLNLKYVRTPDVPKDLVGVSFREKLHRGSCFMKALSLNKVFSKKHSFSTINKRNPEMLGYQASIKSLGCDDRTIKDSHASC